MKLTPEEERYTREVAAQIGRDPNDLIREGEQLKEAGYAEAREQAKRVAGGGRGLGMYPSKPASVRAEEDGPQLRAWQRQADREAAADMPDVTRMQDWQVRKVPRAPGAGLTGAACQVIVRQYQERQAREAEMQARFGCCQPPWAREYVRHGRVCEREREQAGDRQAGTGAHRRARRPAGPHPVRRATAGTAGPGPPPAPGSPRLQESRNRTAITENCTGLLTPFRESASDTPARLLRHMNCGKAGPGKSSTAANCRKVQHWTRDLPARLEEHRRGQGARLMQAIRAAGIGFTLARTWEGTTREREDSLKHRGSARRFCPKCGVSPGSPRLESDRRQMAGILRAEVPAQVPEYDFADWPQITSGMAPGQATELALQLWCGRRAAYASAAAEASSRTGPGAEYLSRFDTATDVDLAWQKTAREIARLYGRAPGEFVNAWITSVRHEPAGPEGQEEDMSGRQARAERGQQAEADRLFALADELANQAGKRPDYQREITAERAARMMRQELATPYGMGYTEDREMSWDEYIRGEFGGDLDGAKAGSGPGLSGGPLDAEIDRLAMKYPEYGPDEFVPPQDRLPPEEGHRAAELQSTAHQIAADNLAGDLRPERAAAQADAMTPEQREERDAQIAAEEHRLPLNTNAKADHPVIDLAREPGDCEAGDSRRERNGIAMRAEWPTLQPSVEAELEAGG